MQAYTQQYLSVGDVTKADVHVLFKGRNSISQVSEKRMRSSRRWNHRSRANGEALPLTSEGPEVHPQTPKHLRVAWAAEQLGSTAARMLGLDWFFDTKSALRKYKDNQKAPFHLFQTLCGSSKWLTVVPRWGKGEPNPRADTKTPYPGGCPHLLLAFLMNTAKVSLWEQQVYCNRWDEMEWLDGIFE